MSTVKIRSLTTTATTTASDDFLVIDGTTNSTRKLSAATPAFLTSVTVPTVATAAGVNLNLATGTAASDKVLIPGTLDATAADGLAASVATLGGASVKKALWVGGLINVAGHTTFEGVTSTGATGTGKLVYDTSPSLTTPALGTPSALVGTNITGTAAGLTAGNVTTNANLTGDVTSVGNATSIAAGVIVDADINASAAIVDTKLDTIATALKVSNSATTAASANTASAIVARDASGNFSAGTVSAALTGNASTATALATGRTIAITGDLAYTSPSFDGTGNVTAAGTLATVASAGTSGGSTAIPIVTINAKGLTTSITTAAVIAPAGTLSGNTLASGVTASSLTSLGTIASLAVTAGTISGTPSASTDIANKLYVDTVAQGLDAKASCVAATTADITLSGTQTIDGISVIAGNRVLVKNQTLSQNNGIYLCASGAWTRTTDADTWDELTSAFVFIETGTVNADTGWVCTANAGGTLGTTALPWSQFSGAGSYTASTGLTLTGTVFSLTAPVTVALGGTNATSAGIASFNNITGYTAAGATGTTSTNLVFSTSPTITSPTITGGALNGTLGATTPSTVAGTTGTFTGDIEINGGNKSFYTSAGFAQFGTTGNHDAFIIRQATQVATFTSTGLNSTAIGATTPSTGVFTTLKASGMAVNATPSSLGTTANWLQFTNTGGDLYFGQESSVAAAFFAGSSAYATVIYSPQPVQTIIGGTKRLDVTSAGAAITGTLSATGNISTTATGAVFSTGAATASAKYAAFANTAGTAEFGIQASGHGYAGTTSADDFDIYVNSSIVSTFSSAGAAITGTFSNTGTGLIGNGTAYAYGLTIKPAANDYTLTLLQSNVNNAGWGMWADTGGGFSLARYSAGVYGTACFTAALGGAISMTTSLAVTGAVSVTGVLTMGGNNSYISFATNASSLSAGSSMWVGGDSGGALNLNSPTGKTTTFLINNSTIAGISSTGLAVTGAVSVSTDVGWTNGSIARSFTGSPAANGSFTITGVNSTLLIVRNNTQGGTAIISVDPIGGVAIISDPNSQFSITDGGASSNKFVVTVSGTTITLLNRWASAQNARGLALAGI